MLPTLLWDEAGKNEDGFDSELLKGSEVGFDALGNGEGKTAGCREQRFFSGRILVDGLEVVTCVDSEPRV